MRLHSFLSVLFITVSYCTPAFSAVTWQKMSPQVTLLQQSSELRFYDSNQVLIEGQECALLFDSSGDFAQVEHMVTTLKQQLKMPLCYLVASHFHDDHLLGMAIVQQAFPKAKLIVHEKLANEFQLHQQAFSNKLEKYEKSIELSYQRLANLPKSEQAQWREKLALAKQRILRWQALTLKAPAITVQQPMALDLGNYPLTIEPHHAHTQADLTITAQKNQILLGGDIVDLLPYPGHGELQSWLTLLKQYQQNSDLKTIIPGHGEPLTPKQLQLPYEFLLALVELVEKYPDADLETLQSYFPSKFAKQYQQDDVSTRAYPLFLQAGLKRAKSAK